MRFRATVLALVSAATLAIAAAPAQASVSGGYVGGTGSILDDWNDEGPVRSGNYSNAVCLWQFILEADGVKNADGTRFGGADIDGEFGPVTLAATKKWQQMKGFTGPDVDGVAGPKTWTRAGKQLKPGLNADEAVYVGSTGEWFDISRINNRHNIWTGVSTYAPATYTGAVTLC